MRSIVILIITFGVGIVATALKDPPANFVFAGNLAMSVMLFFGSLKHFANAPELALMVPRPIPYKIPLVYIGGFFKVFAAAGLLFVQTREMAAWLLIAFQLVILPANIFSAMNPMQMDQERRRGPNLRWLNVPLRIIFVIWTWYFALYLPGHFNPFRI